MASSGYTAITFVANEQPTTAKWNLIGSNDSSFNLGTGLEDSVILARHIAAGALTNAMLNTTAGELGGVWQPYNPLWTANTTNPTIGNGTITGHYKKIGKDITVRIEVNIGSTTNIGSGRYKFSLPFATIANKRFAGSAYALRTGTAFQIGQASNVDYVAAIDTANASFMITSGVLQHNTLPWAVGDVFVLEMTYEMA